MFYLVLFTLQSILYALCGNTLFIEMYRFPVFLSHKHAVELFLVNKINIEKIVLFFFL